MKVRQAAFTLIEIMVVLVLIAALATMLLPRLTRRSPSVEWHTILDDLNTLVFFARQEAIANHKIYRLAFKSQPNAADTITIEEEYDDPEKLERKLYKTVSSYYFRTVYTYAPSIKLKGVYLGKQEMLDEQRGQAFCYVIPDGLVQEVRVQMIRKIGPDESGITYTMNPFFGRFELVEGAGR